MGKLEGKVAVITGGSSGMALASAKLFVEEGAYVFITGRKQEQLDEAVKLIGRNVTGVRSDAANLDDPVSRSDYRPRTRPDRRKWLIRGTSVFMVERLPR